MRLAIIGTGYWGTNHARVATELAADGKIDKTVFCDIDEDRVTELASNYGVDYVTDYRELFSAVDCAVVATPSHTHRDIAHRLLENGVDCLVEKPLAMDSDTAYEIVDTAERENQTLAVGHIFRHHPALQALKEKIDRGDLGRIKYLHTNRYSFRVPRDSSGVLHQLAVHDIDIYRYLLGKHPERIFCSTNSWAGSQTEETAALTLEYGETVATINESWQVPVFGKQRELIVVGTERAVYIDYLKDTELEVYDARILQSDKGYRAIDEGVTIHETKEAEPLREEVVDFLNAVESGDSPLADGKVGAEAVELIEDAIESNKNNQSIPVTMQ